MNPNKSDLIAGALRDVSPNECNSNFEAASLDVATIGGTVAGDSMLPAHGGSESNSIKAGHNMSEIQHQLLITLVHGTWGRGFFPRRQRQNRRPLWFEEGSPFLARLSAELDDIPHKITPLLWSGANSIFVRDTTAHVLAEHLSAEHAEHRQATQLIIAHSHGGNIALRALHHLRRRDASQSCEADAANPLVVTLSTPFVEVYPADFGRRPYFVRWSLVGAIIWLQVLSMEAIGDFFKGLILEYEGAGVLTFGGVRLFGLVLTFWWGFWWVSRRATARQNRLQALNDATQLGEAPSAQRLLVIRAIDDEASLVLAAGTMSSYLTSISIRNIALLMCIWIAIELAAIEYWGILSEELKTFRFATMGAVVVLTIALFVVLMVSRALHGRELAVSPLECQINTQSTPDAVGLSRIVTLVRRTYVKSLRHGIYGHEDCARTISDWVRLRLETN